ncbi:MAG: NAD-dependent epimerase/dehydratase family protein [Flavobacterium sp.]|uniref:NAD-dependent epimerase/dehydratase family protein n=1 Tax=Flavobacterium sp. TaxID=239 RepID=UPI0012089EC9|nr:NAD-dependent epimerase/dehydratase family protein [Flavobacterium sp.]RZJ66004.1 MAG: NAD-dependent epimerase/dehydratase family protein [Flavobacterium sp.]
MKKAGIIGGSGFIGSYVTKLFLGNGFDVKVSSTDISTEAKYRHLMLFEGADRLHIAELDVRDKEALRDFVKDCDIVIHAGTPFQLDVKDPQTELFDPTVNGTRNFLEVIKQTSGIEKVVIVASVASYNANFSMPAADRTPNDTFDENDEKFNSVDCHPYGQAKFLANQTVERFLADNPDLGFEISSVSPTFVIGKSLSDREDSTSGGMQFLFKNKIAPNDFVQMLYDRDVDFAMVDVRDVATAIYKSATTRNIHGKNYLLSSETYAISDISRMLNLENPKNNAKVIYRNDLAKRNLGVEFRSAKETLHFYSS